MKRFLLLLSASLAVAGAAQAQIGVRLGGSLAKLHTTEGQVVRSRSGTQAGYQVGVWYQMPLGRLSLVPEVQYSYERLTLAQASFAIYDASFTADTRLSMHYLSVPVLVRATFGPVYVEAGPQAGVLLGGRQTGSEIVTSGWGGGTSTYAIDQAVTKDKRRFDIGPCLGLGVALPAGLGVNVRAYQGLVTLNDTQRSAWDGKFRRQSLQASLTYQFAGR
jgi:hypothetical protein